MRNILKELIGNEAFCNLKHLGNSLGFGTFWLNFSSSFPFDKEGDDAEWTPIIVISEPMRLLPIFGWRLLGPLLKILPPRGRFLCWGNKEGMACSLPACMIPRCTGSNKSKAYATPSPSRSTVLQINWRDGGILAICALRLLLRTGPSVKDVPNGI